MITAQVLGLRPARPRNPREVAPPGARLRTPTSWRRCALAGGRIGVWGMYPESRPREPRAGGWDRQTKVPPRLALKARPRTPLRVRLPKELRPRSGACTPNLEFDEKRRCALPAATWTQVRESPTTSGRARPELLGMPQKGLLASIGAGSTSNSERSNVRRGSGQSPATLGRSGRAGLGPAKASAAEAGARSLARPDLQSRASEGRRLQRSKGPSSSRAWECISIGEKLCVRADPDRLGRGRIRRTSADSEPEMAEINSAWPQANHKGATPWSHPRHQLGLKSP